MLQNPGHHCPNGHFLSPVQATIDNCFFTCDDCGGPSTYVLLGWRLQCRRCNYDLCDGCANKTPGTTEEAARKQAEEEAARLADVEEAARKKAEEERLVREAAERAEAERRAAKEVARKQAEEEAARLAVEEEAARKKAEEERLVREAAERAEAERRAAEEVARKQGEEEAARLAAKEEAARKKAKEDSRQAEEAGRKAEEQALAAMKKAEEEKQARKAAEARSKAKEEARLAAEAAAKEKTEEAKAAKKAAEEEHLKREVEEAARKAAEEEEEANASKELTPEIDGEVERPTLKVQARLRQKSRCPSAEKLKKSPKFPKSSPPKSPMRPGSLPRVATLASPARRAVESSQEGLTPRISSPSTVSPRHKQKIKSTLPRVLSPRAGPLCPTPYNPGLHGSKGPCERCLEFASEEEKEQFSIMGRHLRIMVVSGGCDRSCLFFPRTEGASPVRLCKKCYFDTHRTNYDAMEVLSPTVER